MITWLFGLPILATLLRVGVAIIEMLVPLVKWVIESIVAVLTWLWQNLWWPGIRGALDGLPQVLVIAQLVGVGYLFYLNASTQLAQREASLQQCRTDLAKARRPVSRSPQAPTLWDPFGWFRLP